MNIKSSNFVHYILASLTFRYAQTTGYEHKSEHFSYLIRVCLYKNHLKKFHIVHPCL